MVGNLDIMGFAASLSIFSDNLKTAYLGRIESIKGTAPVIVCLSAGRIKVVWKPDFQVFRRPWVGFGVQLPRACVPHTPCTRCPVSV